MAKMAFMTKVILGTATEARSLGDYNGLVVLPGAPVIAVEVVFAVASAAAFSW